MARAIAPVLGWDDARIAAETARGARAGARRRPALGRGIRSPRDSLTGAGRTDAPDDRARAELPARKETAVADHVLAIDQGTTSTRAIVFDAAGHDRRRSRSASTSRSCRAPAGSSTTRSRSGRTPSGCIGRARARRPRRAMSPAIGVTNQRETAMVWDRRTGQPGAQRDRVAGHPHAGHRSTGSPRDGGADRFADVTGLPLATYFSASKVAWILDNVAGARAAAEAGRAAVRHARHLDASGTSPAAGAAASTSPMSPTRAAPC